MNRRRTLIVFILFVSILSVSTTSGYRAYALEQTAGTGNVIRLGYSESEEYGFFTQLLLDIAIELIEEGSIDVSLAEKYKDANFEENFRNGDTLILWNDICDANKEGARYRFVREAFFNLDEMDEDEYPEMVNRDDVDVMLSMGTASGVYFSENEHKNKFMNMFSGDPIASHMVKSETERYTDNSYALLDKDTYKRQLDAGYKFIGFKKLGVVYEDSEDAYIYSAIDVVEEKSREYGFEVVYEYVNEPVSDDDYDRYYEELKNAYRKLVNEGIDCLFVTVASIEYDTKMQELLDDSVIPAGIKTLAQDELIPVKNGVLFGVTLTDCAESAYHVVKQLRRYAEEEVPFDQLDMVCEVTPRIGVNYTTALRIGYEIPFEKLQIADYIYR